MPTITDTFTRANSTTTLGSTESPVLAWTANTGTWGISTNRAYSVTAADGDTATINVGQADMAVYAKLTGVLLNRFVQVVGRWVDSTNYYFAETVSNSGNLSFYRRIGGSVVTLATIAFADGDTVGISLVEESGSTRTILYKNGVQQYTGLDSTVGRPAGTRAGFRLGGSVGTGFWDDFSVVYTTLVDTQPSQRVRVEVAFSTAPDDPSPSWTDLTSRLDRAAGVNITRGRQDEYGAVTPSTCSLTLDNTDGELTAGRAASSYYPNVKPSRRIRVSYVDPFTSAVTYRFDGHVEEWPTEWPGGNKYTQAPINAVDLLARLATKRTLRSVVEETVLNNGATAYYPLGEPEESTIVGDVTGTNTNTLTVQTVGAGGGTLTFVAGTGPGTDELGAPMFAPASTTNGKRLGGTIPTVGGTSNITFGCAVQASATGNTMAPIELMDVNGWSLRLYFGATGTLFAEIYDPWSGSFRDQAFYAGVVADGTTRYIWGTVTLSGGTATIRVYAEGTLLATGSGYATSTLPNFITMNVGGQSKSRLLTGTISHAFAYNGLWTTTNGTDFSLSGSTGFAGERSDQRIARIAKWVGLPTARQVLDVGQSTSIAHVNTAGKKPLELMQVIADTEQGALFVDTQGRLVFRNRTFAYADTTIVASVDAHDVGRDTRPTMSKQDMVNDITGKRTDGPEQRYVDAASIVEHGGYSDSLEIAVTSDAEVLAAMQWRVNAHAQPTVRVPNVDIDAYTNPTVAPNVRALDVVSRMQVTAMPTQAAASTLDLLVQGYTETITTGGWQVNANTTIKTVIGFRLDDATFSQFDSTNQLVY